jgi:hypothetical protein
VEAAAQPLDFRTVKSWAGILGAYFKGGGISARREKKIKSFFKINIYFAAASLLDQTGHSPTGK